MYEQHRHYWRVLYPEYANPDSTAHWYGKWKTAMMCMGYMTKGSRLDTSGFQMAHVGGARNPFSFAFIVTAAAGPVVSVVACAGVLIYALAVARGDAARRADAAAAEAKAAAEAVIVEAEAVIAAARLRLLGEAGS